MCGGSGGTSGSVIASITTGRSAASASVPGAGDLVGVIDADPVQADQLGLLGVVNVGDVLRGGS